MPNSIKAIQRQNKMKLIFMGVIVAVFIACVYLTYIDSLKSKIPFNNQMAVKRHELLVNAVLQYMQSNDGLYPASRFALESVIGEQSSLPFCGDELDGYIYECRFALDQHEIIARPVKEGITGDMTMTKAVTIDNFGPAVEEEEKTSANTLVEVGRESKRKSKSHLDAEMRLQQQRLFPSKEKTQ